MSNESKTTGPWEKLDKFLYGHGQEFLGLLLILALAFWTVIGTITIVKQNRLDKKFDMVLTKMEEAKATITTWGESSDKTVGLLDDGQKVSETLRKQQALILVTMKEIIEANGKTQGGVDDLSHGVAGLYDANGKLMETVVEGFNDMRVLAGGNATAVAVEPEPEPEPEPAPVCPVPARVTGKTVPAPVPMVTKTRVVPVEPQPQPIVKTKWVLWPF